MNESLKARIGRMMRGALGVAVLFGFTAAQANISDNFDRADGAAIGNGWIEKTAAAFSLQSGTAAKVAAGNGYLDNLVYRPASEDVLDVEASVQMRLTSGSPGYPQLFVRVQSSSVTFTNWLDGYILYIDGGTTGAVLGRQRGSSFVTALATIPIAPALNTTDTYRLRLSAVGTSPVQLSAFIERLSGSTWQIIGQAAVNDAAADRIATAGTVGFSGYVETAYRFDNFVRTNLTGSPPPPPPPPPDPVPQLTSLAPVSATVGSAATTVTVNGSNFATNSVVRWNGQARATTYVSSTQLRVVVQAGDLATDRIGAITVATNSSASTPLSFFVLPATDTVFFDGFNRGPAQTVGNGWIEKLPSAFEILANGVLWAGNTYPYDFHDTIVYRPMTESQLNVETGVEFTRAAGARFPQLHARVQGNTVGQPNTLHSYILYVEDGITPNGLAIAVQPPVYATGECIIRVIQFPTLPQVGERYRLRFNVSGAYPVTLTGIMERFNATAGTWETFVSGSIVHDANTTDAGYFCPYASVPAPISTAGSVGVAKWWDPVDGYDNFYWRGLSPGNIPQVTSMSPTSVGAGSPGFTLSVIGWNFTTGSTVRWNGSNRPTTFVSSTELRATISAADVAAAGTAAVTVFNSGTGGGVSPQGLNFSISAPASAQFTDDFARPNGAALGNGWVEKDPAAFDLENGRSRKRASSSGYLDTAVYRPSAEDTLNTEVSAELRMLSGNIGYPQLFARIQAATAATPGNLDAYMLYFDANPSLAILGRQRGSDFVTGLGLVYLTTPLNTTDTFRMRLRVTGTTTVQLEAVVERLVNGTWNVVGQTTASDASALRISGAGAGGFGGYVEDSYTFDNFSVLRLD
jgi:hypothetical protein